MNIFVIERYTDRFMDRNQASDQEKKLDEYLEKAYSVYNDHGTMCSIYVVN